jgi:hypothetical protein
LKFYSGRIIELFSADLAVETPLVEKSSSGHHLLRLVHEPAAPLARVLVVDAGLNPEIIGKVRKEN